MGSICHRVRHHQIDFLDALDSLEKKPLTRSVLFSYTTNMTNILDIIQGRIK